MKKSWRLLQPDPSHVEKLCRRLKCSPLIAGLMVNRNLTSPDAASKFLQPSLRHLRPPFGLKDMAPAVKRVKRAIEKRDKIMIFGDYDVDGVTATVILYDFLQKAGADATYHIPHRLEEGYGLKADHIDTLAVPKGINLIVTADCGSASHAAVRRATAAGIDVVVTDHHRVSDPLPPAAAVVNPQRPDCTIGFEHLSGVGVAMAFLICLRKGLRGSGVWKSGGEPNLMALCDLVALGTIADAVPLVEENRIFVRAGVELMRSGSVRTGVRALLGTSRISGPHLTAEDLAFKIIPRLNAAGRMDHAALAARLLMAQSRTTADGIATGLDRLNERRKRTERCILREIRQHLSAHPREAEGRSLVLAREGWHEGVLGIAAARLVSEYHRPVVLISTRDGLGKGSGRSVEGFNLYRGLTASADTLESFGGHAMAAGLSIKTENIAAFKAAFEKSVAAVLTAAAPAPETCIDGVLGLDQITDQLITDIESLQPFGAENSEPLFLARNVRVAKSQIVGGHHRRMLLCQSGANRHIPAIQFDIDPGSCLPERLPQIVYRLRWNRWNDKKVAQLLLEDFDAAPV